MKSLVSEVVNVEPHVGSFNSYHQTLMSGLYQLSDVERRAIFLRFWQPASIEEVSRELKTSWESADRIITQAVEKLKEHFKQNNLVASPFTESRNK